ncbi:MAG TPA: magnesium/cobalt transporter CorA [Gammaproteobacteria bacterium]|nr:magnesium/cobalt transporter CorA [Gammaproteobacteria bacterium]
MLGTYHRPGTAPGTLEYREEPGAPPRPPARINLYRYDPEGVRIQTDVPVADCKPSSKLGELTWLQVQGAPSPEMMAALGLAFDLHPLAMEDVMGRGQRSKFEAYESQYFVVLNKPMRDEEGALHTSQVSFFLGQNYVITFDEYAEDTFAPIRTRLESKRMFRERGTDYLFYSLLDVVIDEGFPLLEDFGERMDSLEEAVLEQPTRELRNQIHYMKRELVDLRRAWWPQRDVINTLLRDGEHMISENTRLYLRDTYDHCARIIDLVEMYRDMASSLLDTYLSSVSQRMNDVMKVLTVFATIFLPLTFITGLYGMNFDTTSPWNMPELHWRFGYFYALGVMLIAVLGMLAYFRRKRWL